MMKKIPIGISQPAGRLIMISQYKAKNDSGAVTQPEYTRAGIRVLYSLFDGFCRPL